MFINNSQINREAFMKLKKQQYYTTKKPAPKHKKPATQNEGAAKLPPAPQKPIINIDGYSITFTGEGPILNKKLLEEVRSDARSIVRADIVNYESLNKAMFNLGSNTQWALEIFTYMEPRCKDDESLAGIIKTLLKHYEFNDQSLNRVTKKYKIIKSNEKNKVLCQINNSIYKIDSSETTKPKHETELDPVQWIQDRMLLLGAAIHNNHYRTTEDVIREILKNGGSYLESLKDDTAKRDEFTFNIAIVVELISSTQQTECIMALKEIWHKNYKALSTISKILLNNKQYFEVVKLLELEIPAIEDNVEDSVIAYCRNNIAVAYVEVGEYTKAEAQYGKALESLKGDYEIIAALCRLYQLDCDKEKADLLIKSMPVSPEKNLLKMCQQDWHNISTGALKAIDKTKLAGTFLYTLECLHHIALYNEGKYSEKKIKKSFSKIDQMGLNQGTFLLRLALYTGQDDAIETILSKIPEHEVKQNKSLQFFRLQLRPTLVTKIIEEKDKYTEQELVKAIKIVNDSLMSTNEVDLATVLAHVEESLKHDPENEETIEYGVSAALLKNDPNELKKYEDHLNEEQKQAIIQNFSRDNEELPQTLEDLIKTYDGRKIHEYYQQLKKYEFEKLKQRIIDNDSNLEHTWHSKKDNLEIKSVYAGLYKGKKCWAAISPQTAKKLDSTLLQQYNNALEKEITYHFLGQNGIKVLKKNHKDILFELKIHGDSRLSTTKLHVSPMISTDNTDPADTNNVLVLFDHIGDHETVDRAVSGGSGLIEDNDYCF